MSSENIKCNLAEFKRSYYLNKLLKGTLVCFISILAIFLIFSFLEGFLWLNQYLRLSFLIAFSLIFFFSLVAGIVFPVAGLVRLRKGISDEQAAREIGKHFPEVQDKLLNYLQLDRLEKSEQSLIAAALKHKTFELRVVSFKKAISFRPNIRYAGIFFALILVIFLVSFVNPAFLPESTARIVQYNRTFEKPAPFRFLLPADLQGFKNEPFELHVSVAGEYLPENVFLQENGRSIRLSREAKDLFTLNIPSLTEDRTFRLEAAGYASPEYTLKVNTRPEIRNFEIRADYPAYTGLTDQVLKNSGSLIVPEGTTLQWLLNTSNSDKVFFGLGQELFAFEDTEKPLFAFSRKVRESLEYEVVLENAFSRNKNPIRYHINVIQDESPELEVNFVPDTITFQYAIFTGSISDDYGFKSLSLLYKRTAEEDYQVQNIPIAAGQNALQFFHQWSIDNTSISEGEAIEFIVSVRDNDPIHQFKQTNSRKFFLRIPNQEEIETLIENSSKKTENQLDRSTEKAESLNENIQELENRLKNKKELGWQDEKLAEDILRDKEKLQKNIEELKAEHEELLRSQKEFGRQSEKLQEKSEKLQELINEVLDEETRSLYEELQKLLREKANSDEVLNKLSQIKSKEQNLERELERALELFKRLKMETKLEQATEKLEKLADKQEELSDQTLSRESDQSKEQKGAELSEQQKQLNEEFKEIEKDMQEAGQLNEELKNPEPMEDLQKEEEEIREKMDEIPRNLDNKNFNKAGQQQKNTSQKMQQMAQKMEMMQSSAEMIVMQENLDHLRDILDNLIKLSFQEETLIDEFKAVDQIDPRFIELSQSQLKLIENSRVIEDSLLSLASRVVQISNFVTREIGEINDNLEKAMNDLRDRNKARATSHQQFAMTSMNNLALLLDDVLSQMQMAMAEAMGTPQKGGKPNQSLPDMSELQEQLSQQIQDLKKSGKSGRQLSEELARLAAEQAEIRKRLQEMQEQMNGKPKVGESSGDGDPGSKLKEAIQKMEENEVDLVNKQLTENLVRRQKEIVTRMLEAEESLREQQQSPEREGETATEKIRKVPPAFEEYMKAKESEIELLKTIPLDLNPFYKKEVNDYFRRLSGQEH